MSLIGLHEFYIGCMGLGFVYVAGSFFLSGGRAGRGARAGRGVKIRGAARGGARSSGSKGGGGARSGKVALVKGGTGIQRAGATRAGGSKGGPHKGAAARSGAKGAAKGAAKGGRGGRLNADELTHLEGHDAIVAGDPDVSMTERLYFLILQIINPLTWSIFLFFFGAAGIVIQRSIPDLPMPSYFPAAFAGLLLGMLIQRFLDWFMGRFESPTTSTIDDAIGLEGEVTVSIMTGHTGEVVIYFDHSRRNYPARSSDSVDLLKGSKIVVAEIDDKILIVEQLEAQSALTATI